MTRTKASEAASGRKPQTSRETALTAAQLDAVRGGQASTSLYNACTTGKHIPTIRLS